jgi:hypothetical protein
MADLIFEISDSLCESIVKSKAVIDLLRAVDGRNLSDETLPDIGWLLDSELERMQEQVNRLPRKSGN